MRRGRRTSFLKGWISCSVLVAVALLTAGCSTTIERWSEQSYRSPTLTSAAFADGGVALLPIIVLPGQTPPKAGVSSNLPAPYAPSPSFSGEPRDTAVKETGGYRLVLDEIMLNTLKDRWPTHKLLSTGDTLRLLNDAGLAEEYGRFDRSYATSGLDGATLGKFGDALKVRYLFISRATLAESTPDASVSFIWSFGRKSVLRSVNVVVQIWDTVSRQNVWEGSGRAANRLGAYEKPPLTEQLAGVAISQMVEALPF